jgi:hypothetical protein
MRQLLCFGVSLLDQVNVPLRGFDAFLRFLLKGVQNINPPADLDRQYDTVGVRRIPQGNFNNAAADTLERFGVLGHTAKLDELKLVAQLVFVRRLENPEGSFSSFQARQRAVTPGV